MNVGVILARFQPIHNGHLALIHKAVTENDKVIIFIGSADKLNARNPIPCNLRHEMVVESLKEYFVKEEMAKITIIDLPDLTDESDNSHDWGFYLYSNVVTYSNSSEFTMYYSDGFEIITSWFPGWILRKNISLSLIARESCVEGISATKVREMILSDSPDLKGYIPEHIYNNRKLIKAFLSIYDKSL